MRPPIISLVMCAVAACSTPARPHATAAVNAPAPATAAVAEPVRSGRADVDLTGSWTTGNTNEPEARQIQLRPECNYSPALWLIDQRGDTVRAWRMPASHAQGIYRGPPPANLPQEGWISGSDVVIDAANARYLLHYDSTSGHLRGTLNGASFWAIRVQVVRPDNCIPVP